MKKKIIALILILISIILIIVATVIDKKDTNTKKPSPIMKIDEDKAIETPTLSSEHTKDNLSFTGFVIKEEFGIYVIYANATNKDTENDIKNKEISIELYNSTGGIISTIDAKIDYIEKGSATLFKTTSNDKNILKTIEYKLK